MARKPTLDRIEFDNETYQITGRTSAGDAALDPVAAGCELQTVTLRAGDRRPARPAPLPPLGALPDDLFGRRERRAAAADRNRRGRLH